MKKKNKVELAIGAASLKMLDISELTHFQGDLKNLSTENYHLLKNEILKHKFSFAVHAWETFDDDGVSQYFILDGHQRVRTLGQMREEGFEIPFVPVILVEAKDFKEAKEKVLAGTSQYGELHGQGLYEFIADSGLDWRDVVQDFRFPEISFPDFAAEFYASDGVGSGGGAGGEPSDELPPEPPAKTKKGDLIKIGEHLLLCGDCTDPDDVQRLLGNLKVDLTFTDPPYNVGIEYGPETDDEKTLESYRRWSLDWFALCPSESIVFTPGTVNLGMWLAIKEPQWVCAWRKANQCSSSRIGGFNTWEPILVYGKTLKRVGHDSWDFPVKMVGENHPVPKSIEAWRTFIEAFSEEGMTIYEPFAGSGTAFIVGEQVRRKVLGIEISPKFCDLIVARFHRDFGADAARVEPDGSLTPWSEI